MNRSLRTAVPILALILVGSLAGGCHRKKDNSLPAPTISNINNSSAPASPVDMVIEINGAGFLSAPGSVRFAQDTNVVEVVPDGAGWSDTGVAVVVPTDGSGGPFTVPGTVTVQVSTQGGTSGAVTLSLVTTPAFSPNSLGWAATTSLPTALRGLAAVTVENTSTSAWLLVAGGQTSAPANVATVTSIALNQDGTLAAGPWLTTAAMPQNRAYHAMVYASSTNSPVTVGAQFIYVIGGQQDATDAPGGTDTVFRGSVLSADGSVGSWSQLGNLPVALVAPAATLYNGYIYVVGGLLTDGSPSGGVYSAKINSDGSLGSWTASANVYPTPVSFARIFGFGGKLYVVGGGTDTCTTPNLEASPAVRIGDVNYATARNGAVGAWASTSSIQNRAKHVVLTAFGQVISGEGVGGGVELQSSSISPDGTLASFNGLTGARAPSANVFSADAVVSPLLSVSGAPRFLLIGGQQTGGAVSAAIYYNNAP